MDHVAQAAMKTSTTDKAHDVLHTEGHPLDALFHPKTVAVIGATERPGSIGRRVLWALVSSPFGGTVYPVSKDRASVLGIKAYPNVAAVPEAVDMAVIATPAATVPGIIGECAGRRSSPRIASQRPGGPLASPATGGAHTVPIRPFLLSPDLCRRHAFIVGHRVGTARR